MKSLFTGLFLAVLLSACTALPDVQSAGTMDAVDTMNAVDTAAASSLATAGAVIQPPLGKNESAFQLLPASRDALQWRLNLIDAAESTIEAQYFVWHADAAGSLLLQRLFQAADRGVRVRLLVDDLHLVSTNVIAGNDTGLAALDYHPNLELRLFNPGSYRDGVMGAAASMVADGTAYNRRMHNKLLVVDGVLAIVGGRNIGEEYFGLAEEFNFVDLDVAVFGAVLPEISAAFDQYWNAELAYPAGGLAAVTEADYLELREENRAYVEAQAPKYATLGKLSDPQQAVRDLLAGMQRGQAIFLRDEPIARTDEESRRLYDAITELDAFRPDTEEFLSSTPYLIPSEKMLELMQEDNEAGIRVRMLTNSLATNNQPAVHSHYKKYRNKFLDMNVELFELHPTPQGDLRAMADTPPVSSEFLALHMKAAVVDGKRCFIGTLNSDPRSMEINTENVMYVDSPGLCGGLKQYLDSIMSPEAAWEVSRDESGDLQWTSFEGTVNRQPARSTSQRLMDSIYRLMPEGQL